MIRNNTNSILKSTQSLYFQHKTILVEDCMDEQKATDGIIFCHLEVEVVLK